MFYTPDAPRDEELGFQVDVSGAYKLLVIPAFVGESVVESTMSPVCDCDNITQITSTPVDVSSSPSADTDTVALPSAIPTPDIPAVLASADSPLLLPLLGSTSSEHELRNLLSTIPISVSDEFILDPRDWNIPSMTVSFLSCFSCTPIGWTLTHPYRMICLNIRIFLLFSQALHHP